MKSSQTPECSQRSDSPDWENKTRRRLRCLAPQ